MAHDMNPQDDERDEEEEFITALTDMVDKGQISLARVHLRAYIDHVRPLPAEGSR